MINKDKWLTVGLITSCHGINGQVKVKSLSDFEERFLQPGARWLQKENGNPNRFSCDIFIEGLKESSAFGKSHKQAETNAARILIEKFITAGKI